MKFKSLRRVGALGLAMTFAVASMGACGKKKTAEKTEDGTKIKDFTMFCAMPKAEINANNDIKEIIAQKIGARCKE